VDFIPRLHASDSDKKETARVGAGRKVKWTLRCLAERVYHAMSTSPQVSASAKYLDRMREERYWNNRRGHRAGVKFGPTLPVNKSPDRQAAWAWEEAQKAEGQTEEVPIHTGGHWFHGSSTNEAKDFFKLLERGVSDLKTLRRDIAISREELADLTRWITRQPKLESRIKRMIDHRVRVLDEFNRLVAESCAAQTTPQNAAAD